MASAQTRRVRPPADNQRYQWASGILSAVFFESRVSERARILIRSSNLFTNARTRSLACIDFHQFSRNFQSYCELIISTQKNHDSLVPCSVGWLLCCHFLIGLFALTELCVQRSLGREPRRRRRRHGRRMPTSATHQRGRDPARADAAAAWPKPPHDPSRRGGRGIGVRVGRRRKWASLTKGMKAI